MTKFGIGLEKAFYNYDEYKADIQDVKFKFIINNISNFDLQANSRPQKCQKNKKTG